MMKFRPCLFIGLLTVLLLCGTVVHAADWQSWTSFSRDVRRMRVIDDMLYVASSGGLLEIEQTVSPGHAYNNLNGLGTTDVTDIIEDADGQKWVTGYGRLIKFNGIGSQRFMFADNQGDLFALYCVEDDGNRLWIGSERGLVLFSKTIDGGLILDNYSLFGDLSGEPEVYDIELVGDTIMLATSEGIAVADKTVPSNLKAPANWLTFSQTSHPEMTGNLARRIVRYDSQTYVGLSTGLFRLDVAADTLLSVNTAGIGATPNITEMKIEHDTLFVYSYGGYGAIDGGGFAQLGESGMPSRSTNGARTRERAWLFPYVGGLYFFEHGAYERYPYEGLPDNQVCDVCISPDGLVTALMSTSGLYELISHTWVKRPVTVWEHSNVIVSDPYGRSWVGTWGSGLSVVSETVVRYTQDNSTLRGVSEGPGYIVVTDLAIDNGYAFVAVYRGIEGVRVAVADIDSLDDISRWTVFGSGDGIGSDRVASVAVANGAVAVATQESGLYYYYYGSNPFNKQDDSLARYYEGSPDFRKRILSDDVRVVKFSPDGELWAGTNYGLTRLDRGVEMFVTVNLPAGFGPEITAIEFDSRGNAWVGATNGLALIDAITGEIEVFTSRSSGLLDDGVAALTLDENTGEMYVSTAKGITVIPSRFGVPTENIDAVFAFPNPYVIDSPDDELNFNYAGQATLRIFTIAGELVAELPEPRWNGRNQGGETVASGVYLFVLNNSDGEVGRGKFLLVRN